MGSAPSCTGWPFLRGFGAGRGIPFPAWSWRRRAPRRNLRAFLGEIRESPPPRARVEELVFGEPLPPAGYGEFSILPSRAAPGEEEGLLVPPDTAVCPSCRRELLDPGDRRYRYPFINCTDCGPRFTIIEDMPYDRERTSMKGFSMCPACREEYGDIGSRRYHAQPDCCPACGPRAFFCGPGGEELPGDPISLAQRALGEGKVVAVKGLGGFHLACDAENEEAVRLLRARKRREEKPLALMCRDLETARLFCRISPREEALLQGPEGPIVLLEKRDPEAFPFLSANNRLGILLPYTPLHILLLDGSSGGPRALVMTSANPPHRPVYLGNREALAGLSGIAEGFLLHNRPIRNRCDDSLLMEWQGREYFFRRSRGYAPGPVSLSRSAEGVVAFGAEQKGLLLHRPRPIRLPQPAHRGFEESGNFRPLLVESENLSAPLPGGALLPGLRPAPGFRFHPGGRGLGGAGRPAPYPGAAPLGPYGLLHGG